MIRDIPPHYPPARPNLKAFRAPDKSQSKFLYLLWRIRMWVEGTFGLAVLEPWEKALLCGWWLRFCLCFMFVKWQPDFEKNCLLCPSLSFAHWYLFSESLYRLYTPILIHPSFSPCHHLLWLSLHRLNSFSFCSIQWYPWYLMIYSTSGDIPDYQYTTSYWDHPIPPPTYVRCQGKSSVLSVR